MKPLLVVLTLLAAGPRPSVPELASQVTIRRDRFGVPHILAENEEAASFGMGYAQAEDHAVEVARRYVSARGEEAKHLGSGVESDFRMKRFGNYEGARKNFHRLGPLFQRMMNAHASGFNYYVEKHRLELPSWIPVFDGVDVLARSRAEVMRFALREDLAPPLSGSNMWAIAGVRTASGNPILLGNPHQPCSALFWEAHITVPGKVNFFGATYAGVPVLRHGFNERLGWTHTVNYPDLHDTYALPLDPHKPDHYLFDGQSLPLTQKVISVQVKDAKTETRVYWESHMGPVLRRTHDQAVTMKSSLLDAFRYFETWYAMNKAKNFQEFRSILAMNLLPMFNLAYADAAGNIFYLWNGAVPKRLDDGTDYRRDLPGESGKYVWRELHKLEELPQLFNPSGGYVQNCNDPPWYTSLRNLLDPRKYPSYFEPGRELRLRTQMSLEMLESQEKFSLDDVRKLKFNTKMLLADRVKPDLVKHARQTPNRSAELDRALAVIEAWDNHTAPASKGGVLFQRFWDTYRQAQRQPFAVAWDPKNPARTPSGLSDPALAVKHLEDAARWTRATYGSEAVAWGDVHRVRVGDVDLPAGGAPGEYGLFRVMSYASGADARRVANSGDGWIMTVEFSRPLKAYSVLAYGQRPGRSDQAQLFANHQMKPVWFSEAEIRANLERSYRPGQER